MKTINVFLGLLTREPESIEHIRSKEPIKIATLIAIISALFPSIVILLIKSDIKFILLSMIVFGKIIFQYWLVLPLVLNFVLNTFYSGKGSLKGALSLFGFLSPLFALIMLIGILIANLPTIPFPLFYIFQIILTFYFILLSAEGLAVIYKKSRKRMILTMFFFMLIISPIFAGLRYFGIFGPGGN